MARLTKAQKQAATVDKWLRYQQFDCNDYQEYLYLKDLELLYEPRNYRDYMVLCDRNKSAIFIIDLVIPKPVYKTKDLIQWEYGLKAKQDHADILERQPYMDSKDWPVNRLVANLLWYGFHYDWCSSTHYCQ
jgi:hypothetical protein